MYKQEAEELHYKNILKHSDSRGDGTSMGERNLKEPKSQEAGIRIDVDPGLRPLLPKYLEGRKKDLVRFKEALANKNFEFIRRLSHEIKGHGASYGFIQLTQICNQMENAAVAQNAILIGSFLGDYEKYIGQIDLSDKKEENG